MLVLTRKLDETIVIGDNIEITVLRIRNNQIRLGIKAPRDVRVMRGELDRSASSVRTPEPAANCDTDTQQPPATRVDAKSTATNVTIDLTDPNQSCVDQRGINAALRRDAIETLHDIDPPAGSDLPRVFQGKIDLKRGTARLEAASVTDRSPSPLGQFFTAP
ncbi:MAG: carbon storage regulator [Planctomycetota bacterium]